MNNTTTRDKSDMKLVRAVTYARVSKDDTHKDDRNLQGQLTMCKEYGLKRGYQIVAELSEDDRGASGADWNLPELNRALEMANNGDFDVLIVRELDRFARGLAKQLVMESTFKRAGVEVEYVLGDYPDTPEGQLNKNIRAVIAEFEREKIKERMTRGRYNRVKAGAVLLHGNDQPPYGYSISEDGKSLIVNESEARIVRLIFTWYAIGDESGKKISTYEIAKRLTKMGVPTWSDLRGRKINKKRGYAEWSDGTISSLLTNETYIGDWHYGRKRKPGIINPREHWITIKVPPIVSRDLWDSAKAQREYNKKMSKRNTYYKYLVARRTRCGKCGYRMHARSTRVKVGKGKKRLYQYYVCAANNGDIIGKDCDMRSFRSDKVDRVVWNYIQDLLTNRDKLSQGLKNFLEEQEQANTHIRERLDVVEELLKENDLHLKKLLDLYLTADFPEEMLLERRNRLEETNRVLVQEQAHLTSHLELASLTVSQIETLQQKFFDQIQEGLDLASASFETRLQVIDILDVKVTLAIENGQQIVYVHHTLYPDGNRLLLNSDKNENGSSEEQNGTGGNRNPLLTKKSNPRTISPGKGSTAWPVAPVSGGWRHCPASRSRRAFSASRHRHIKSSTASSPSQTPPSSTASCSASRVVSRAACMISLTPPEPAM